MHPLLRLPLPQVYSVVHGFPSSMTLGMVDRLIVIVTKLSGVLQKNVIEKCYCQLALNTPRQLAELLKYV